MGRSLEKGSVDQKLSALRSRVAELEREILERGEADQALQESEERLARIYDSANDGIFVVDPLRDNIVEANPKAAEIVGYAVEELAGMPMSAIHPDEMPQLLDFAEGVISSGKGITDSLSCLTKSGIRVPVEMSASALHVEGRSLMLVIVRDITERVEADQALRKAMTEIEALKNRLQAENIYLQDEIRVERNFEEIITCSEALNKSLRQIEQVASTDATVLILGESGTGKELLARAVHGASDRAQRPMIKVNCATLPENLIESELFGHEKGAFTGAIERRTGRFELADGGTLFLDEIGDLPLELQPKLLRVLQEGEFERVGSPLTMKTDVRVIAATNRELEKAIKSGDFREDLYYRLNVFPILCPPLRERKEDIPLLASHFALKYSTKFGKRMVDIPREVIDSLQAYDWPGNIRELENIIERAIIINQGRHLDLGDWLSNNVISSESPRIQTLEELDRQHISNVLELARWKVRGEQGAAKMLGMKATTLEARMKKLGIKRKT